MKTARTPEVACSGPLGLPRLHLRRTDSTNDRLRALVVKGAPHGTLVTADEQTAGKGRHGRRWDAPPRCSLLMSLLLRWSAATTAPPLLPLLAAVAVCDVVGPEALVKWPNDVVLRRQATSLAPTRHPHLAKLAGILIESSLQERWLVLGIGLNVAVNVASLPSELHTTAATLDRPVEDVETILHELLRSLERWLARPTADVLARWRGRDALLGTVVEWSNGRGMAEGVSDDGELLVRTDDGIVVELDSGEVSVSEPRLTG